MRMYLYTLLVGVIADLIKHMFWSMEHQIEKNIEVDATGSVTSAVEPMLSKAPLSRRDSYHETRYERCPNRTKSKSCHALHPVYFLNIPNLL